MQFLVSTKQVDKARAFVAAAYKAQPDGHPSLTLALCSMLIGDSHQAESQLQAILGADPEDPAGLAPAIASNLTMGRTDRVDSLLDTLLHHAPRASADDLAWARRTRATLLIRRAQPGDLDQALELLDRNLAAMPPPPRIKGSRRRSLPRVQPDDPKR